jgi:hypothetical protein
MAQAIRDGEAVALVVSPEIYHDQIEAMQQMNSAYIGTGPEVDRLPWLGIEGIPVIVSPDLEEDCFALMKSRDWIDDMRIALDIHTDGMIHSTYKISGWRNVGD